MADGTRSKLSVDEQLKQHSKAIEDIRHLMGESATSLNQYKSEITNSINQHKSETSRQFEELLRQLANLNEEIRKGIRSELTVEEQLVQQPNVQQVETFISTASIEVTGVNDGSVFDKIGVQKDAHKVFDEMVFDERPSRIFGVELQQDELKDSACIVSEEMSKRNPTDPQSTEKKCETTLDKNAEQNEDVKAQLAQLSSQFSPQQSQTEDTLQQIQEQQVEESMMQIEAHLHIPMEVNEAAESNPIIVEGISIQDVTPIAENGAYNDFMSSSVDIPCVLGYVAGAIENGSTKASPNTEFEEATMLTQVVSYQNVLVREAYEVLDEMTKPFWTGTKAARNMFDKMPVLTSAEQSKRVDAHEDLILPIVVFPRDLSYGSVVTKVSLYNFSSKFNLEEEFMCVAQKIHELDVEIWVGEVLMIVFDPGGSFWLHNGCDSFEFFDDKQLFDKFSGNEAGSVLALKNVLPIAMVEAVELLKVGSDFCTYPSFLSLFNGEEGPCEVVFTGPYLIKEGCFRKATRNRVQHFWNLGQAAIGIFIEFGMVVKDYHEAIVAAALQPCDSATPSLWNWYVLFSLVFEKWARAMSNAFDTNRDSKVFKNLLDTQIDGMLALFFDEGIIKHALIPSGKIFGLDTILVIIHVPYEEEVLFMGSQRGLFVQIWKNRQEYLGVTYIVPSWQNCPFDVVTRIARVAHSSEAFLQAALTAKLIGKCIMRFTVLFLSYLMLKNSVFVLTHGTYNMDPGLCVVFVSILEDKDVFERVGKDIVLMDTTLEITGLIMLLGCLYRQSFWNPD